MQSLQRPSFLIGISILVVTACVIPTVTIIDPAAQATIVAVTVNAAIRGTQQVQPACAVTAPACVTGGPVGATPSATASHTPPPTVTPSPTETPSPTAPPTLGVIASPTSIVPMISVSVATNCRSGPGKAYPLEGALLVDEVAQVLATDPTASYWYIPNPDAAGDECWVWGEYATITGYVGAIPVFTPPPTPLPTMTSPPSPGFGVSYDGLLGCSGEWWTQMELSNTGALTFRSMEFSLTDQELDIESAAESDGFVYRANCSSVSTKETVAPGASLLISSPKMSNDPSGHKMRARITLCSETGQNGQCVTVTYNFKP